jgi:hypothetical protein
MGNWLTLNGRRAIAASRSEHADDLEEDRQLQEAIRLSMGNEVEPSTNFEDQLKDRNVKMKRKAEGDLRTSGFKRSASEVTGEFAAWQHC